jgi:ketosteroid isomerase-like protein
LKITADEVADRFFRAIEQADLAVVSDLYGEELRVWHSSDGAVKGKAESLAILQAVHKLGQLKYNVIERVFDGERLAQRHDLIITKHSGEVFTLHIALFMTIENGQITSIHEYVDAAAITAIMAPPATG